MPKRVDHDERRREITDAVCRLMLRAGPSAITFREVAKEAGISVRLVQYYFGSKEGLLDTTLEHVGERSIARLTQWIEASDGSPRGVLEAFLKSFAPRDEESTVAALMYIALAGDVAVAAQNAEHAKSAQHGNRNGQTKRSTTPERQTEAEMMHAMVLSQLERADLRPGIVPEIEAALITSMMPGLGHYVLDKTMTLDQAMATIDYHLDRVFADPTDEANDRS